MLRQLENLRIPFVYRKYFDFDALAALRALRERIRLDWERRALARNGVDSANNIKLGDGGIREIEFVVQLSQLIRGGRMPALRKRGLVEALHAERDAGLVSSPPTPSGWSPPTASCAAPSTRCNTAKTNRPICCPASLSAAPRWPPRWGWRRTPSSARWRITAPSWPRPSATPSGWRASSTSMKSGLASRPPGASRASEAAGARVLAGDGERQAATRWRADTRGFGDAADELIRRTETLLAGHRIRSLLDNSRRRVDALLPAALAAAAQTGAPQEAAIRLLDLRSKAVAQRSAYPALLAENSPDTWPASPA